MKGIPHGILKSLGGRFRLEYYRTTLIEPHSLTLCLVSAEGNMLGIASGSLDAAEHMAYLKRRRFHLAWAAAPVLIRHPLMVPKLIRKQRNKGADGSTDDYIVTSGPRLEFWGVTDECRSGGHAVALLQAWLSIAKLLGADLIRFEVNASEERAEMVHRKLGATLVKEFVTPEGTSRKILQYERHSRMRG
jgi:hypothetical protein